MYNKSSNNSTEQTEGKFNSGIDTLMDISLILKELRNVSVRSHLQEFKEQLPIGRAQHIRVKLLRHLFIRSVPLIDKKLIPDLKKRIFALKVFWRSNGAGSDIKGEINKLVPPGYYEGYSPNLEDDVDEIIVDISIALQESGGYFMAAKDIDFNV